VSTTSKLLVAVLLLLGIVPPLLVGIYDREDPTFIGFPFYYWFQFLLIPIVSILTYVAYRIVERGERR
jgi:hypothetical protein